MGQKSEVATLEAAQKMGELLLQIQRTTGNQYTNSATPQNAEKQKRKNPQSRKNPKQG